MDTARSQILDFIRSTTGWDAEQSEVEIRKLRGGLVSSDVVWVNLHHRGAHGERSTFRVVVKTLSGDAVREAEIYTNFVQKFASDVAPRLIGVEYVPGGCRLYLEAIRVICNWPWRDLAHAECVMKELARLHRTQQGAVLFQEWDYNQELTGAGASLLTFLKTDPVKEFPSSIRRSLPALRRIVTALPQIRHQLHTFQVSEPICIHGDVHPGNVKIRRLGGRDRPIFIDWGRLRSGSPLEDVSSWLQSLGYWEPHAKQRHDTLLAAYLSNAGQSARLTRDLRDAYWLAAACNQIAGAALYHLARALDARDNITRTAAMHAAGDCFRVIRRADACWKN